MGKDGLTLLDEKVYGWFFFDRYKKHKPLFEVEIDTSKLPIIAETKIYKESADMYGKVILKLDLEKERENKEEGLDYIYSYKWEVDKKDLSQKYEEPVLEVLKEFCFMLRILNNNKVPLRFTVTGGDMKANAQPIHHLATIDALIGIFKKLNV